MSDIAKYAGVTLADLLDTKEPEPTALHLKLVRNHAQQAKLAALFEAAALEFWPDAADVAAQLVHEETIIAELLSRGTQPGGTA